MLEWAKADTLYTPETSSHFEEWVNRSNGIKSYILKNELVPVQQAFYYTNSMMTDDGKYKPLMTVPEPPK